MDSNKTTTTVGVALIFLIFVGWFYMMNQQQAKYAKLHPTPAHDPYGDAGDAPLACVPNLDGRIDASEMKAALAKSTGLLPDEIGLKATTNEGVGDLGRGLAIAAHAVALVYRS